MSGKAEAASPFGTRAHNGTTSRKARWPAAPHSRYRRPTAPGRVGIKNILCLHRPKAGPWADHRAATHRQEPAMTVDAPDKSMRMSGIQGLRLDPPLAEVRQSPGTPEMSRMRGLRPGARTPRGAGKGSTPRGRNRGASNGRLPSSTIPSSPTDRTRRNPTIEIPTTE